MLQYLIDIKQLNHDDIIRILDRANLFLQGVSVPKTDAVTEHTVAHLFFEPSTRTLLSFELAAKRLGWFSLTPHLAFSSLVKGETITDMIQTIAAIGVRTFVIRHAENGMMTSVLSAMPAGCHLINAGEGSLQHPTQGLLDLLTIQQSCLVHDTEHWGSLRVAIIGDVRHSRVAHSLVDGLTIMGVSDIRLIAPAVLLPEGSTFGSNVVCTTDIQHGLCDADVVVCLRLQKERMPEGWFMPECDFYAEYGLTTQRLKIAKKDAIVLHPGPINRDVEISSAVADGPQSRILQQVTNGVVVRMAVLEAMVSGIGSGCSASVIE